MPLCNLSFSNVCIAIEVCQARQHAAEPAVQLNAPLSVLYNRCTVCGALQQKAVEYFLVETNVPLAAAE